MIPLLVLLAAWMAMQPARLPGNSGTPQRPAASTPAQARVPAPRDTWPAPTPRDGRDVAGAANSTLPPEALRTLRAIDAGGPFRYRQDGGTFGNRERRLPARPRGWYREYTVDTPGARDRGARRIVTGGDPPREFFYSGDHYRSFRRIDAQGRAP